MHDNILDHGFTSLPTDAASRERLQKAIDEANELTKSVRSGRNWLWVVVVLSIIGTVIGYGSYAEEPDLAIVLGFDIFVILLFVAMALLLPRKPYLLLVIAVVLYVIFQGLAMIADPGNLLRGLLIRGLIIYYLVRAAMAAKKLPDMRARLAAGGATLPMLEQFDKLKDLADLPYLPDNTGTR